jgi:hypothetical protein
MLPGEEKILQGAKVLRGSEPGGSVKIRCYHR